MHIEDRPPQTQYIGRRGGRTLHHGVRTLHHGVRLARSLGIEPNLFVTLNFWETSLTIHEMAPAFLDMRRKFVRWIQNPSRHFAGFCAPPTFLWVLENPEDRGFFHAHWLVFVPPERHRDFAVKLERWLRNVAPIAYSPQQIHIEPISALIGVTEYMLKGQIPPVARYYGITPEYQGWIPGTKRSGCSKNLGPTHHEKTWKAGKHKRPENWRPEKYQPRTQVM